MKYLFSFVFLQFFIFQSYAQRGLNEFNVIGISGGINLYDINTKNVTTRQGESLMLGFQMRGNVYNNFDMIYGLSFQDTKIGIQSAANQRNIEYTIQSAQLSLLLGYKIISNHLSIEGGPILNVNGKMKLKHTQFENEVLLGFNELTAKDIQDISKINAHLAIGVTAGLTNFRIFAQYQYGVTNMLNKLNDQNLEITNFKGNASLLVFGITGYF